MSVMDSRISETEGCYVKINNSNVAVKKLKDT
jgi:hypothetical protein